MVFDVDNFCFICDYDFNCIFGIFLLDFWYGLVDGFEDIFDVIEVVMFGIVDEVCLLV